MQIPTAGDVQNAVAVIVAALKQGGPALTERELLGHVVDFANGEDLAGPLASAPDLPPALPPIDRLTGEQRPGRLEFLKKHRADLRTALGYAVGKGLPPAIFDELRQQALQMVDTTVDIIPEKKGRPRLQSLRFRRSYFPMTLQSILARTVLLLRDKTLDLGSDLKQCALPSCARPFFFVATDGRTPRGRPRLYCSDEHMDEGNRLNTAARMRKLRNAKPTRHK